jgi:hypothetical protein
MVAGNFCGDARKEILLDSSGAALSLLDGPAPHFLKRLSPAPTSVVPSEDAWAWAVVAAGNLDSTQPYDQIVYIREHPINGWPQIAVLGVTSHPSPSRTGTRPSLECGDTALVASTTVNSGLTYWLGAAVGNFDGTGKKRIATLDRPTSTLTLFELNQGALTVTHSEVLRANTSPTSEWKVLTAGDIDHDGTDELIAARQISDGHSDTVVAFKWNGSSFVQLASSTFGNNGNSDWEAATAGDFNADGRYAVVLVKDKHSNFAVIDFPAGAQALNVRATADLDSAPGQAWLSLAATDWLGGDQAAAELIAFRYVSRPFRTNFFVYGNPYQRLSRDSGLEDTKAQWVQNLAPDASILGGYFTPAAEDLKAWIGNTHTTVFNWYLGVFQEQDPNIPGTFQVHNFSGLVDFLSKTKDWGIDGRQLRVWVTLSRPSAANESCRTDEAATMKPCPLEFCAVPEDTSQQLTWNALDYFKADFAHDYAHLDNVDRMKACRDLVAWSKVIGRLAQDFTQLVAMGIDDFSDSLDRRPSSDCNVEFQTRKQFGEDCIATIESGLRAEAPWLNFVPSVYYGYYQDRLAPERSDWADLVPTLDSIQFFFRNEKDQGNECITNTLKCTRTVTNAPDEIRDMQALLPSGRKLQLGAYFVGCGSCGNAPADKFKPPEIRYSYDLVRIGMNMPMVGGVTAYGLQTPPWVARQDGSFFPCSGSGCAPNCTDFNFLDDTVPPGDAVGPFGMFGTDRYCALQRAYRHGPQIVQQTDLTPNGPQAVGKPAAFFFAPDGTQQAIYRTANGHLQEVWWGPGPVGQGDLTPTGPFAANDPAAYFLPSDGAAHVVYRSSDGHLRELLWSGPNPPAQRDLTPTGPAAIGKPATFFYAADGTQQAIYRTADGHLREVWWGPVPLGQGDLTPSTHLAADDPTAYSDSAAHVIYRSADGHVRELVWNGPSPPAGRDLTPNSPPAVGRPSTFLNGADGTQQVIYRTDVGYLQELWWGPVPAGQNGISPPEVESPAASDPSGYFVSVDGSSHVIYRSQDGHLHELFWNAGAVSHNDLTALADAPTAVAEPAAYFLPGDAKHHVLFVAGDGHLHELRWSN